MNQQRMVDPASTTDRTEQVIESFESLWQSGAAPRIDEFLNQAAANLDAAEFESLLGEILRIDLEYRFHARATCPAKTIEEYLSEFPQFAANIPALRELIADEFRMRISCGEASTCDEYLLRFPDVTGLHERLRNIESEIATELPKQRPAGTDTVVTSERTGPIPIEIESRPAREGFRPGQSFGDYRIVRELGRGASGIVFLGWQQSLKRLVAIKLLRSEWARDPQDVERFRVEAQAVAQLTHPGIVPVYEIGCLDGFHYLVLQFIEGTSAAELVENEPASPRRAAKIVKDVAEAIDYCHRNHVVHRDLKPGNILLHADGAKVTDFGLAKRTNIDSQLTATHQILGTPAYMPPEQVKGDPELIGPASDIYSLGATLYCLLTGRPPFFAASVVETLRQVEERDPVPLRRINPHIPRDLENICQKCLRKKPEHRYSSAGELAADLDRFLQGAPVQARPISLTARCWRWCRRRPRTALAVVATGIVLMTSLGIAGVSYVQTRTALEMARDATDDAKIARERAEDALAVAERERIAAQAAQAVANRERTAAQAAQAVAEREKLEAEKARQAANVALAAETKSKEQERRARLESEKLLRQSETVAYAAELSVAEKSWRDGDIEHAMQTLSDLSTKPRLADLSSGWEYRHLKNQWRNTSTSLDAHSGLVAATAISDDGAYLATASGKQVKIWRLPSGEHFQTLPDFDARIVNLGFDRGGGLNVLIQRGELSRWNAPFGQSTKRSMLEGTPLVAAFAARQDVLVYCDEQQRLFVVDLASQAPTALPESRPAGRAVGIAIDAAATAIAVTNEVGHIQVFSRENGSQIAEWDASTGPLYAVAFDPHGERLAFAGSAGVIHLWNWRTGDNRESFGDQQTPIHALLFDPTGVRIWTSGGDACIRVWNLQNRKLIREHRGHKPGVYTLTRTPDGSVCASGAADGQVRLWQNEQWKIEFPVADGLLMFATSRLKQSQAEVLLVGTARGQILRWPLPANGAPSLDRQLDLGKVSQYATDSVGGVIAAVRAAGPIAIVDSDLNIMCELDQGSDPVQFVSLSPSGSELLTIHESKRIVLWNIATGQGRDCGTLPGEQAVGCAFVSTATPVVGMADGRLWDVNANQFRPAQAGANEPKIGLAAQRTGSRIAWTTRNGDILLAGDLNGATPRLQARGRQLTALSYHPNESRLVSAYRNGRLQVWDTQYGLPLLELNSSRSPAVRLVWSTTGNTLFTACEDGQIEAWRASQSEW